MGIGKNIKRIRESKGITQETLAEKLGYAHKSSINKIELDKADITATKLLELSNALDVSPIEILGVKDPTVDKRSTSIIDKKKVLDYVRQCYGDEIAMIIEKYDKLNTIGKQKINESICDLSEIEKYRQ